MPIVEMVDQERRYTGPATEGTYAGSNGAEVWKFKTPELNFNNASLDFAFAIYYNRLDTGEWFWDDNFSQNYKLSKMEGSTIQ